MIVSSAPGSELHLRSSVREGQRFLSGVGPVAERIVGGWGFNGITTFQSGFPLSISSSASSQLAQFGYNTANTNTAQLYPNVVAGCDKNIPGPLTVT